MFCTLGNASQHVYLAYTHIISLSGRYVLLKMGTTTLDTFAYNTYKFCYNRDMTILYINFDWFTVPNKIDV